MVPPLDYFRHCATFFEIWPPSSFWFFATESMLIKLERSPLLHFMALLNIFQKKKIQKLHGFFPKKMFSAFRALDIAPTLDVLISLGQVLPYQKE